jgi:PAS domain S-box-containing protein
MKKSKIIFSLIFLGALVLSFFYLNFVWSSSLDEKTEQVMTFAKASEISLNGEMLRQLRGTPEDLNTVAYRSIKNRLIKLKELNSEIKFVYLYMEREGRIYIMADSEPTDSKDYPPPGQEYTEVADQMKEPFKNKIPVITEPITDRWGTWVSVLVPMMDTETSKVMAVFGFDYPAESWTAGAIKQTFQSGLFVAILLLLLLSFYIIIKYAVKLKEEGLRIALIKNEQENIFDSVPAWIFYKDDKNNFIRVNKAFAEAINIPKEKLEGASCFNLFPKEQAEAFFKDDLAILASGKPKTNIIEKMASPKGERWVETDKIILKNEDNKTIGIIGFSVDITDKKNIDDEIKKNNEQLERVNRLMVGRELEMINLKKELANCKNKHED